MARSPAVNALNELADELYNAACFIGKPFTVDSREVKEVIRRVVRDSLTSGATRDDVWRFMRKVKNMQPNDTGTKLQPQRTIPDYAASQHHSS
jgi:hypothetical protein